MKISARNQIKGTIVEVIKGQTTAHIRIDANGTIITASITNEAVDELGLAKGKPAYAVIKASDVMVARRRPVPLASTVTVAFGIARPLVSEMVPVIVARSV